MNKQEKSKKEIIVYVVGWYRGKGKNKYWQSVAVFDSDYKQSAISWKKELNSKLSVATARNVTTYCMKNPKNAGLTEVKGLTMPRKRPTTRICNTCKQAKPYDQFHPYVSYATLTGRRIVVYSRCCLECRAKKEQHKVEKKTMRPYRVTDKVIGRPYSLLTNDEAELYQWFIKRQIPLPKRQGDRFHHGGNEFKNLKEVISFYERRLL